jgi:hypothetical protein
MITSREKIISKALEALRHNPDGMRYSELVRKIKLELPAIPLNTIHGTIWDLDSRVPNEFYKPAKGVFRLIKFKEEAGRTGGDEPERPPLKTAKIKEESFYKPFADWLVHEMEECTNAMPLGGNKFKDKWGTPDVIGRREPLRSDIIKGITEIVSAEIKTDTKDLITAFGQACSYKLFSNKSYIVVPKNSPKGDISKLDALCLIFGIGLVLFDNSNHIDPHSEIKCRPLKHEPDMFYVNKYMKLIEEEFFR